MGILVKYLPLYNCTWIFCLGLQLNI